MDLSFTSSLALVRDSQNSPEHLKAYLKIIANKTELSFPVFTRVPSLEMPDWQMVIENTVPCCKCGLRRMIVPSAMAQNPSFVGDAITVSADAPLTIAPWGGDWASALVGFSIKGTDIKITSTPFPAGVPVGFALRHRDDNSQYFPLVALQQLLESDSPRDFASSVANQTLHTGAITQVDCKENTVQIRLKQGIIAKTGSPEPHFCM